MILYSLQNQVLVKVKEADICEEVGSRAELPPSLHWAGAQAAAPHRSSLAFLDHRECSLALHPLSQQITRSSCGFKCIQTLHLVLESMVPHLGAFEATGQVSGCLNVHGEGWGR